MYVCMYVRMDGWMGAYTYMRQMMPWGMDGPPCIHASTHPSMTRVRYTRRQRRGTAPLPATACFPTIRPIRSVISPRIGFFAPRLVLVDWASSGFQILSRFEAWSLWVSGRGGCFVIGALLFVVEGNILWFLVLIGDFFVPAAVPGGCGCSLHWHLFAPRFWRNFWQRQMFCGGLVEGNLATSVLEFHWLWGLVANVVDCLGRL